MATPNKLEALIEAVKKDPQKGIQAGCGLLVAVILLVGLSSSPSEGSVGEAPRLSTYPGANVGSGPRIDDSAESVGTSGWNDRSLPRRQGRGGAHAATHPAGEECDESIAPPADPVALEEAIGRFRRSTDQAELEELAVSLGQVDDPRVENLAIQIAEADPHPMRRVAAFDLLDALEAPGAIGVVLHTLDRERDPAIRRAALFALPRPEKAGTDDAGLIGAALITVLASDPDPEARRRAALALGTWSCAPGAVLQLATALRQDPSALARGGCAFALERAGCADPAARSAVLEALADEDEDPVVRDNAWHALATLSPLSEDERTAWTAWRDARSREME